MKRIFTITIVGMAAFSVCALSPAPVVGSIMTPDPMRNVKTVDRTEILSPSSETVIEVTNLAGE